MNEKPLINRKSLLIFAVLLVILFLVALTVCEPIMSSPSQQMSYNDFITTVRNDSVAQAEIGETEITWEMKDSDQTLVTTRIPSVNDDQLIQMLQEHGVQFSGVKPGFNWWPVLGLLAPIGLILFLWMFMSRRMRPGGGQQIIDIARSKAKTFNRSMATVRFDDVAGVDKAKMELQEIVDYLKHPRKYQALGGRIPRGLLLVGPPGTGKTLLARATAGEANVPFFSMEASQFVEMFVGVGASRVRDMFEQAKRNAPAIIFIDELDTIGRRRSSASTSAGHEEQEQTLNQLLSQMDGFDSSYSVIVLAATNRPDVLDPALLRPGRFDRQVIVDRPDIVGREQILNVHSNGIKTADNVDMRTLAARTPGFVGSDLANIVNEAALLAARKNKDVVTMEDFDEAIDRAVTGLERKGRVISQKEKEIVSYHEMGHTLVAVELPRTDPVQKVTIIGRSMGALGMTQQTPLEDKYLSLQEELEERIAVALGGRVAESIIFGSISTGTHNNLSHATQLARRMVREFGMSERLGPVAFIPDPATQAQNGLATLQREYGDQTATLIDREVSAIIDKNYQRAHDILSENRDILEAMAKQLMEEETLQGRDLRQRVQFLKNQRNAQEYHPVTGGEPT
jgi:cell division protease FtsH